MGLEKFLNNTLESTMVRQQFRHTVHAFKKAQRENNSYHTNHFPFTNFNIQSTHLEIEYQSHIRYSIYVQRTSLSLPSKKKRTSLSLSLSRIFCVIRTPKVQNKTTQQNFSQNCFQGFSLTKKKIQPNHHA